MGIVTVTDLLARLEARGSEAPDPMSMLAGASGPLYKFLWAAIQDTVHVNAGPHTIRAHGHGACIIMHTTCAHGAYAWVLMSISPSAAVQPATLAADSLAHDVPSSDMTSPATASPGTVASPKPSGQLEEDARAFLVAYKIEELGPILLAQMLHSVRQDAAALEHS